MRAGSIRDPNPFRCLGRDYGPTSYLIRLARPAASWRHLKLFETPRLLVGSVRRLACDRQIRRTNKILEKEKRKRKKTKKWQRLRFGPKKHEIEEIE